jgi:hypothetical protein
MRLVWLPLKLVLGGVTLAGAAALGCGLGALTGLCCARLCRAGRTRAEAAPDRGTASTASTAGSSTATT